MMLNTTQKRRRALGAAGSGTGTGSISLFRRRIDVTLLILDFLVVTGALALLWHSTVEAFIAGAIVVTLIELSGLYHARITLSAIDDFPRLAGTCIIAIFFVTVLFNVESSRWEIPVRAASLISAMFVLRVGYFAVRRSQRRRSIGARRRTVIVGGGIVAAELTERIAAHPDLGLEMVAVIDSDPMFDTERFKIPVLADVSLRDLVEREQISTVIVAFRNTADSTLVAPLRECDRYDCEILIVPRLYEFVHLGPDMDRVHTIPLIRVRRNIYRSGYWRAKRAFDFMMASFAVVVLSPLLAVTAAAVYLRNRKAPIIFRQVRVGRHGREFTLYKFRSMEPVPANHSDTDWSPKAPGRITPLGRLLRKTSLDELPQLWNVVRGDMSLVGPRPERPHFVEQFGASVTSYQDRHRVDVGLTGWAAINGLRGDTSIHDRVLYDNFYIENWSVWLDIKIIILTIRAVFRGTGS
jgi:exopolysaccharide biosynthesis polyprenyl glycosylphosphotransferase